MIDPCLGSRKLVTLLKRDQGVEINRKRVQRLRREIGQEAIWCKPRTSIPDHGHRKYPYLLRDLTISRPDQGCQFTSAEWTGRLLALGVKISMDGRGHGMDNGFTRTAVAEHQIRGDLSVRARHRPGLAGGGGEVVRLLQRLAAP